MFLDNLKGEVIRTKKCRNTFKTQFNIYFQYRRQPHRSSNEFIQLVSLHFSGNCLKELFSQHCGEFNHCVTTLIEFVFGFVSGSRR